MPKSNTIKKLHPNNRFNTQYDFDQLIKIVPQLSSHIKQNPFGEKTINFSNPQAVKLLNKALIYSTYPISYWQFSDSNLCPPVPGRADYIHYLADLVNKPTHNSKNIKILDIGVGATLIYPLIGVCEYNWEFVGSDSNDASLESSQRIIDNNPVLQPQITLRKQKQKNHILEGVVQSSDYFHAVMCNPPFFASQKEADYQTNRKIKNLSKQNKNISKTRNFSGQANELWYEGGEKAFVNKLINESKMYADQIEWFTCLISNRDLIKGFQKSIQSIGANICQIIEMHQGNKTSKILAWTYKK